MKDKSGESKKSEESNESELEEICKHIVNLVTSHIKFIPARTVRGEVIEDFHHHYLGDRGYEGVGYPAHYDISEKGRKKLLDYLKKLLKKDK